MAMNSIFLTLFIICMVNLVSFSQEIKSETGADTVFLSSPVKAVTDKQYTDLKQGNEMGMGRVAELNNYPSPVRVSELEQQLNLNPNQKIRLKQIIAAWQFKTKEMGRFIIAEETRLDNLFSSGKATDGAVIYYSNRIGLFLGELRNAHLQAHLKTRNILTPAQIKRYNILMGYVN